MNEECWLGWPEACASIFCAQTCTAVRRKLKHCDSVRTVIRITMSRTFNDLHNYLTANANANASLQIDDHPSLPITLSTLRLSSGGVVPIVATHGKEFRTIEHLFNHYNKYNAGRKLDARIYSANNCQRLLQYIVFQEGPYNQLSVAQTLELSPEEWAEMPALEPVEAATPVQTARNTVTNAHVATRSDEAQRKKRIEDAKAARRERIAELHRRCDAIERSLAEMREERKTLAKTTNNLELASNNIELATKNVEAAIRVLTNVVAHTQQGRTRSA